VGFHLRRPADVGTLDERRLGRGERLRRGARAEDERACARGRAEQHGAPAEPGRRDFRFVIHGMSSFGEIRTGLVKRKPQAGDRSKVSPETPAVFDDLPKALSIVGPPVPLDDWAEIN
jgi:hypothetical protein